ncbi:ATP/GTP-binding protein [Sphaerospermopsis aphanizomenoides BCCUSP55]|uniref:GTP-binding protein n=1 Tax=Sphaerospermopsis aphanizomenoides TaxID=459663 RepID=UPI000A5E8457|nr:ATP/GTP-binding protein [Sphaerospermopsis aphanizomenoides]MBK1988644.1 ATP/GTP-binding protein [Sphaerospermopsis aphanizomenoides BCCUSP55]
MEIMRLIVTGSVGAGKSTFIRSISEIEVVDTDTRATDETALLKQRTTVAFDFGRLQFGPDMALHLYGTPGQSRFDFMWDILIRKAHAYILLIAAHRPREFRHARKILNFMQERAQIPMILGLTHTDCPGAWSEEDVYLAIGYVNEAERPPMVRVNPNAGDSVAEAVIALVQHLMESCAV